jgi:hypothetical protein
VTPVSPAELIALPKHSDEVGTSGSPNSSQVMPASRKEITVVVLLVVLLSVSVVVVVVVDVVVVVVVDVVVVVVVDVDVVVVVVVVSWQPDSV